MKNYKLPLYAYPMLFWRTVKRRTGLTLPFNAWILSEWLKISMMAAHNLNKSMCNVLEGHKRIGQHCEIVRYHVFYVSPDLNTRFRWYGWNTTIYTSSQFMRHWDTCKKVIEKGKFSRQMLTEDKWIWGNPTDSDKQLLAEFKSWVQTQD